ncbi:MAG: geranylgeranyl diphosphate synthase, type [Gaiellales bacterium]|nr:geranylgeranyl diphosphate synthase, type [Gaiellales bacterium]
MPDAICASRPMEVADPLAPLRAHVEQGLRDLDPGVPDDLGGFGEALRYPLLAGGKRLRPVLCLATGQALGLDPLELLPTALALELVHTFSLVHDDLPAMDDDHLRRGLPTTHVRYGEDVAILVGDALLAAAFQLVAEQQTGPSDRRLAVLSLLARATGAGGMIGGQYLDVRAPDDVDEQGLERLHRLKTGALLEASVSCAVRLAEPERHVADALGAFAGELGLLFQIVDDVLDATGSDDSLGKPAGSDERQGRRTYVSLLGLAGARERAERCERAARAELSRVRGETRTLVAVLEQVARRTR